MLLKKIIDGIKNNHAVIPAIKTNDATKRIEKNLIFKNILRESLVFSQTPQGFTFNKIYKKHKENINESFEDDSALFTNNGEKVLVVKGSKTNFKITDKEDFNQEIFVKIRSTGKLIKSKLEISGNSGNVDINFNLE